MSEDDDGGMQWFAEVGQHEQESWGERDCRLLEEHRQWVKKFHEQEQKEKADAAH